MIQHECEDFTTNVNQQNNINLKSKNRKKIILILSIVVVSVLAVTSIIIAVVVLKRKKEEDPKDEQNKVNENAKNNEENNTNKSEEKENKESIEPPQIYIEEIMQSNYCIYSILKLKCINLNYYTEIKNSDISFIFPIEDSSRKFYSDSINGNIIEKIIPSEAISGSIILDIEKLNYTYQFSINILKDIVINLNENIKYKYGDDMTITNELISKNKNNYSIIYSFTPSSSCIYDIEISSSIAVYETSYLYADIDYNLDFLIKKGRNIEELVKKSSSTRNTDYQKTIHGSFYLEEKKEYFLKIAFLKSAGMYTYNINGIKLIPNNNQNKEALDMGYTIYKIDFFNNAYYPFYAYWAYSPNYIKIENEYGEFYYNQEAYDEHYGTRQYKGAELTSLFSTIKDGWYGYKVYFTDDYPKDANTTIITQIFNNNRVNTWAGHLHTRKENLFLGYRSSAALKDESNIDLGKIIWNKWYNVVIYFKVGKNNKGKIKVWFSQNKLTEEELIFNSGDINFGFGSWIDDETLDNTKIEENGKTNQILCKFGLYTWDGGDKIIRFKNFSALEYNPNGAFDIVNPS